MVVGDVKAGSLTVAAGSRMRGQVEFGWGEKSVSSTGHGEGGPRRFPDPKEPPFR